LNCFNAPSSSGVQDFVLSGEEVAQLAAQIAEMDAFIRGEAARRGYAYSRLGALYSDANVKAPFHAAAMMTTAQPYGPLIGLDGIHPSAAGQAVIADDAARALNQTYNLGIQRGSAAVRVLTGG
jgi:lysophospholipase L1-like esterase